MFRELLYPYHCEKWSRLWKAPCLCSPFPMHLSFLCPCVFKKKRKKEKGKQESKQLPLKKNLISRGLFRHFTFWEQIGQSWGLRHLPHSPVRMECSGGWAVHLKEACPTDSACIYFKVNTALFFQFFNWKINKTTNSWNLDQREKRENEKKIGSTVKSSFTFIFKIN